LRFRGEDEREEALYEPPSGFKQEGATALPLNELYWNHEFSDASFYAWRAIIVD
jgi:hypothetical protein